MGWWRGKALSREAKQHVQEPRITEARGSVHISVQDVHFGSVKARACSCKLDRDKQLMQVAGFKKIRLRCGKMESTPLLSRLAAPGLHFSGTFIIPSSRNPEDPARNPMWEWVIQ